MSPKKIIGCIAVALTLIQTVPSALAQDTYPSRPIKMILPFATGGQSDVVARLIAARMSTGLGQPIVVENLPGAGGMIAAATVARAPADGYTIFLPNASTLTIAPYLQKSTRVDPTAFTPITTSTQFPLVLVVNSKSPFISLGDIVAVGKANPGKLSYASPGVGTTPNLIGETFKREAGLDITHVAYKGGAPALNDLLAGTVDLYFEAPATLTQHIAAGKLRALAVTGKKRIPVLPQVPTVAEQGMPKLTLESWSALVAPPGTPANVVARLRVETEKVLKSSDLVAKLNDMGFEATTSTPDELTRMIRDEGRNWAQLIKERNITVD